MAEAFSLCLNLEYIGRVGESMRGKHDQAVTSPVMTVAEICQLLRIHQTTLYRMIKKHEIPYFRMGSDYRFNRQVIDEWRRAQEVKSTPPSS